ncbi:hypothetical protein MKX54_20060 [Alkalihalobacillus sp. FSL R5-0424]
MTHVSADMAFYNVAASASTIKTFDGRVWKVKGVIGIEDGSGKKKHIAELYYHIASMRDRKSKTIAKRKNKSLPLVVMGK